MRTALLVPALLLVATCLPSKAQDFSELVSTLRGAKLIAQDDEYTYLGTFESSYAHDSVFNTYGSFGSEYSRTSIWNTYGTFGGEYSRCSPFNAYTSTPPMIIKNGRVIGYLTTNKSIRGGLNPGLLKVIADQF